jgi:hypothetical protein
MEACFFSLLILAFFFFETVKLIQKSGNTQQQRNSEIYSRQVTSEDSDQKYLQRISILDAAEDGYFFPGGEKVFEDEDDEKM